MSLQTWQETIVVNTTDGPTLTAAARASCIPTPDRYQFPNYFWYPKRIMKVMVGGRISCAVTTPGTARFDICLGAAGTTIVYDTGAINLNVVAKTTVPFYFEAKLLCRAAGATTITTFFPMNSYFVSEALVGSPVNTAGGNGSLLVPVGAPAVGAGFDNTVASFLDVFFTQTVATGSMTVHTYQVDILN